ncbi:marine proteobacterial sortase target protein [Dasania sp. GY-MA-18]|uniref:Marine proteobacterial sortase target protein n=1 Tax=Dasania phycosphaerae TaxID=2950436 RepID=A0A9J6RMD9_9GAMM|nr:MULTISPECIES: marine proteobacterial sortase target protein [Dasania]MCR8922719.1 marine proteobacterial sortase target protein [Dasania sp. GY-MA-18]MCZ0865149.1 marine proteobacterial sortase target protein [Dasania phycosphaerae]MCZ0868875.1 marine proteobacterial sortase target protein [Dasania phycosphaerae]
MFKFKSANKRIVLEDYSYDYPYSYRRKKSSFKRLLCLTLVTLLLSGIAWYSVQADTADDARHSSALSRINEVQAGQLLLQSDLEQRYQTAELKNSKVHFSINGMLANVALEQSFNNSSGDWVEGVYVFPLPDTAAVYSMRIKIGDRVIVGSIKEKQAAKKIYLAAKQAGKKAGLVEQQRPNLFTAKVANIPPDTTVQLLLQYTQTVNYQQGKFSLRFPMTITPRFLPGLPLRAASSESAQLQREVALANQALTLESGLGWGFNTDVVSDGALITPWLNPKASDAGQLINPISISADIDMGMPLKEIASAYHDITVSKQQGRYQLQLSAGQVSMAQDFELSWQALPGQQPQAALFVETIEGEHEQAQDYALLMLMPSQQQAAAANIAREVIYILDTSGSMAGVSIRQARASLIMALSRLRPQDYFNVIEFNSQAYPMHRQAVAASANNVQLAIKQVQNMEARGGTNMQPALQMALQQSDDQRGVRQVVFITDGAVGNEADLFKTIHKHLAASRLFTVGIGSAPNSYFMRKAAQFGRGSFTHIGSVNEVQPKMAALFQQLENPVLTGITITWPKAVVVEQYPEKIPDLYQGQPLLIKVAAKQLQGELLVQGYNGGELWQQSLILKHKAQHSGVAKLWAREKIAQLLDEVISGRDEAAVKPEVVAVAVAHQLLSPYTSFVAVEDVASRPSPQGLVPMAVLNARPKGQAGQSFAYPNTATRSQQSFYLGLLLLLLAAVVYGLSLKRREQRL